MDISVIIPIYGVEKYVERSLRSYFSQTKCDGVEFILVDDNSPDKSMDIARSIIEEYVDLDIKVVKHLKNRGLAAARQSGMEIAKGEYVIHLDSDDWCEPTMLEELYSAAKQSCADVVICDYFVNYPAVEYHMKQSQPIDGVDCLQKMLEKRLSFNIWSKFIHRSIFRDNNIEWIEGLDMGEDFIINTKLFSHVESIYYLPKPFLHYRQNETSMTKIMSDHNINRRIRCVEEIDSILHSGGLYERLRSALNFFKISSKQNILACSSDNRAIYAKIYPEVTPYILREKRLPYIKRVALWSASKGALWIFNSIYTAINIVSRITRRGGEKSLYN